jgi:putative oxidoreductase
MKFLSALQPLGLMILRIALGVIFIYHGYPKLAHANGSMQQFFQAHGLPGYLVAVSGVLESFGGALLIVGLFTRPVALLLAGEMVIAIWKVHSGHGIMSVKDYEFPLSLAAACFALATIGPGMASLDHVLFGEGSKKRAPFKFNRN